MVSMFVMVESVLSFSNQSNAWASVSHSNVSLSGYKFLTSTTILGFLAKVYI